MKLNITQIGAIASAIVLLLLLQFVVRSRPSAKPAKAMPNVVAATNVDFAQILLATKKDLPAAALEKINALETELKAATTPENRVVVLKKLASEWYTQGKFVISGQYATDIATLNPSDSAWSMAGTTFMFALREQNNENLRTFAAANATKAFEHALSLNPTAIGNKINLALSFVDGSENPMKGIGMLTALTKEYPNDPTIFMTLGKLAMRTGQYDKAVGRFEKVIELDKTNKAAHCLLADAFEHLEQHDKAVPHIKFCK
jgi:tetratricopeptide (TPR) repeat protein